MEKSKLINVEVAYALPKKQMIIPVKVPEGTTVLEAARLSGIADQFEGLDLDQSPMGVFGKSVRDPAEEVLNEGDRVELYRPLLADPKAVRAKRAAKMKEQKEGETETESGDSAD